MGNLFLKPAPAPSGHVVVRDPVNWQPLAAAGEWKPSTTYWRRRLRDGDVIDATAAAHAVRRAAKKESRAATQA